MLDDTRTPHTRVMTAEEIRRDLALLTAAGCEIEGMNYQDINLKVWLRPEDQGDENKAVRLQCYGIFRVQAPSCIIFVQVNGEVFRVSDRWLLHPLEKEYVLKGYYEA